MNKDQGDVQRAHLAEYLIIFFIFRQIYSFDFITWILCYQLITKYSITAFLKMFILTTNGFKMSHTLICLLRVNCLSLVIPSIILHQSCEVMQELLSNTNSTGANDEDDNIINWIFFALEFMSLLENHSMACLQPYCRLHRISDKLEAEYETWVSSV